MMTTAKEIQFARIAGLSMNIQPVIDCSHDCTSMCRHNGCNCECGEFHDVDRKQELDWVGSSKGWALFKELQAKDDRGEFYQNYPWKFPF
jgi:hypothetical protein